MSRFDASGGKMYVPRDRYSFKMSFCVVPASAACGDALLVGEREVHAEQPHRGGVDRHRRVHLAERDAVEQRAHLAEVRDRHADLADLAARERCVGVVAGLGREVEGHRQPGLTLRQVRPVQLVRRARRRVPRVRPDQPGAVALGHRHHSPGSAARWKPTAESRPTACTRRSRGRSCGRGARRSPCGAAAGPAA